MPEDGATQRPRHESDGEGAVGAQRPGERVERREEEPVEHQRRCRAIEKEVVPLDRGADEAGHDDPADLIWLAAVICHVTPQGT